MIGRSLEDARERRRALIADLKLRRPRITVRQLRLALAKEGTEDVGFNGDTGKPWSLSTIQADLDRIREDVAKRYDESVHQLRNRELALLEKAQELAVANQDVKEIISVSRERRKLLALDKLEQTVQYEVDVSSLTTDEMQRLLDGEPVADVLGE